MPDILLVRWNLKAFSMQLRAQAPQYENARMQYSEIKEEIYHSMTMTEPFPKRWAGVFEGVFRIRVSSRVLSYRRSVQQNFTLSGLKSFFRRQALRGNGEKVAPVLYVCAQCSLAA